MLYESTYRMAQEQQRGGRQAVHLQKMGTQPKRRRVHNVAEVPRVLVSASSYCLLLGTLFLITLSHFVQGIHVNEGMFTSSKVWRVKRRLASNSALSLYAQDLDGGAARQQHNLQPNEDGDDGVRQAVKMAMEDKGELAGKLPLYQYGIFFDRSQKKKSARVTPISDFSAPPSPYPPFIHFSLSDPIRSHPI